jgi:hypothetical protein
MAKSINSTNKKINDSGKIVVVATDADIDVRDTGLVRIDGVIVFRKVIRDGILHLQFVDKDRMRNQCRGAERIEIPLGALLTKIGFTSDEPVT